MIKKILIVEDNEKNMYLLSFIIEKMKHRVLQAKSGEEGVDMALKELPDLILMDIQLPGIDGLETIRRIRESGKSGDVPIIAVTSYAMTGDKERLLTAGCSGYIEKPINPETIMAEIASYLEPTQDIS
ncbi:MAG TPA: response regulator [Dissulfurispiraceae bacterium]|nr:response regulator [Dissulfurispiraceae bacterium]